MKPRSDLDYMLANIADHARDAAGFIGRDAIDPKVIAAMKQVPRELFVPEADRPYAFGDHPISIGCGQTISQPFIVAVMSDLLDLKPHHKVLEVGTGSGYQTAVLAKLAGVVHSVEIIPELAEAAGRALQPFEFSNVYLHTGDGSLGLPDEAPFDRIMAAAAADHVPGALTDQLAWGGKLLLPVGDRFGLQHLTLVEKDGHGRLHQTETIPVAFVPLTGRGD